jgi:tetratricopeptide (TPR) repeat protein
MSEQAPASESHGNGHRVAAVSPAEHDVSELLAAIAAEDGKAIAEAVDKIAAAQGIAGALHIREAVLKAGLGDKMLDVLKSYSNSENTSVAWAHLSLGATFLGYPELALDAARTGFKIDPADPNAAFMLIVSANDRGDFQEALNVAAELYQHVEAARNDPALVVQFARAQIGIGEPLQALSLLDASLPNLTKNGLGFDGRFYRARALRAIPERLTQAVDAWEAAIEAATIPAQIDHARDGLIETLVKLQKYDAALKQLELAMENAANEPQRFMWSKVRPSLLARTGDVAGALNAAEDVLKTATNPKDRLELRLLQARIATFGKLWAEAGAYFDQALVEIASAPDRTNDAVETIRFEKIQSIGSFRFELVSADLDALDAAWTKQTWPVPIDLRIVAMLASEQGSNALTWLDERVATSPALANHPAAYQLRGEIQLKLKGLDAALPEYEQAINVAECFRDDPRAWAAALMGSFIMQRWKAVVEAYQQLGRTTQNNQDPSLRMFAAQAHLRLGEFELAINLTDDELPASAPAIQAVRDSTRAEAQFRLGLVDEALATADAALRRAKDSAVPAQFLLLLNLLRAQALNAKEKFAEAYDAATTAIKVQDDSDASLKGLTSFVRLAAYMQRSAASYRLGNIADAHRDVDTVIMGYEQMRDTSIVRVVTSAPEFDQFEFSLWFAKAAILDAEQRTEEALAAYQRAEPFETNGNAATVGLGYGFIGTGAFAESLDVFDRALSRATSARERSEARAGRGRALVRLGRFEEAVAALQAALGERLTDPEEDPQLFELLGIAYDALERHGAANRAFRRAWKLTRTEKHSANLVRGITAAELRLKNPKGVLDLLDKVFDEVQQWRRENPGVTDDPRLEILKDSKLMFNRALALDGIGERRKAIRCLKLASDAGLDEAREVLNRFNTPDKLTRWTNDWFGLQARLRRRVFGFVLVGIAFTVLGAPLFQWWVDGKIGWYVLLVPSIVALLLLALPNIKSIGYGSAKVEFGGDPLPATGREATAVGAPGSFNAPVPAAALISKLTEDRKAPPEFEVNISFSHQQVPLLK